ncbi:MAG: hypothetical protein ACI9JN_002932, partial [Bacteroidia bacterium]
MSTETHQLEQVAEYVARVEKVLPINICQSLNRSISESYNTNVSFKPA